MTDFSAQLQEMDNNTVKVAIKRMKNKEIEAFNETLEKKEFVDVKSYFNDMNTLVWIVKDKNKEAFEIAIESLNRKAPIKTYSDNKEQIIIYTSVNNGYVILLKDLENNAEKAIIWNAQHKLEAEKLPFFFLNFFQILFEFYHIISIL